MTHVNPRRILFVAPNVPFPPTWGFALRVYNLARELAKRHHVALLAFGDEADAGRPGLEKAFHEVHLVPPPAPWGGKRWSQLASLFTSRAYQLSSMRSAAMQRALDGLLAEQRFDIVQIESIAMAGVRFQGPAAVLDEHNIEYELLRLSSSYEASRWRRLYNHVEHRKLRREEVAAWARFDGCMVTSPNDQAVVRADCREARTCVVPNAVDLDFFRPGDAPVDHDNIVFTGTMNYRPNADAMVFFVREILPRLRRLHPSVRLTVVGQGVPDDVRSVVGEGIEVTGRVPDVRPYLARAAVVVTPLRIGSGTRLKILEAMAMAKPVVSTSLGCQGIAADHGRQLLIADDPDVFADEVAGLMSDPGHGRKLGAAGRALVERGYGWAAAAEILDHFHGALLMSDQKPVPGRTYPVHLPGA